VASLRHGALSSRLVGEEAAAMVAELRASGAPWLEGLDAVALEAWAYSAVTCRRLRAWIDEHGDFDAKGEPRHAHRLLLQWERRLDRAAQRLGLDPLARAVLARDSALARHLAGSDLAGVRDAGRRALEARQSDEGGAA
jgi:hypothetical protein